jgi:hypothetical protein
MTSLPKSTAFYAPDYGFTRMTINNKTHITIQQISVEKVLLEKNFSIILNYEFKYLVNFLKSMFKYSAFINSFAFNARNLLYNIKIRLRLLAFNNKLRDLIIRAIGEIEIKN